MFVCITSAGSVLSRKTSLRLPSRLTLTSLLSLRGRVALPFITPERHTHQHKPSSVLTASLHLNSLAIFLHLRKKNKTNCPVQKQTTYKTTCSKTTSAFNVSLPDGMHLLCCKHAFLFSTTFYIFIERKWSTS